jgi:hypothetical protein
VAGLKIIAKRDFVDARFPLPSIIIYGKETAFVGRKINISGGVSLVNHGRSVSA